MKGLLFVSLLTSAFARNPFDDVPLAQPFTDVPMPLAQPFPLDAVKLAAGSRLETQRSRNIDFLMALEPVRLTCLYTAAANLTCSSTGVPWKCDKSSLKPSCTPYGHPRYWGHYLGHYLSALAMGYQATGDEALKERGNVIVQTLAKAQAAQGAAGQPGFLFPYSIASFDRLYSLAPDVGESEGEGEGSESGGGNCQPVCVPFYVMHKVFAGMLDQYTMAGNADALRVAIAMGNWTFTSVTGMIAKYGIGKWQGVLGTEWGGMNEALYNLYGITQDTKYLKAGLHFNHWQWTSPLAIGVDDLDGSHGNVGGNHANTHIPEIIGSARGYELTGNATMHSIAKNFFNILTAGEGKEWDPAHPAGHSWATGGSNAYEHWFNASQLGDTLGGATEESCTQYNVLKVARHLFQWSASAPLGDFYERSFLNGILGNQNLNSTYGPHTTELEYMLPLGGGGLHKPWSQAGPGSSFPCCWGTLSETFNKLSDSIYFKATDDQTLFVNLFESSSVKWQQVLVTQTAGFPVSASNTTIIRIAADRYKTAGRYTTDVGSNWTLAVRVPFWATNGNTVTVTGTATGHTDTYHPPPGDYVRINRAWQVGDTVTVQFPMSLRFEQLSDARPKFQGVGTIMFGPMILAGLTSSDALYLPDRDPATLAKFITRVHPEGEQLRFQIADPGQPDCPGTNSSFELVPFADVTNHMATVPYTVYFHTAGTHPAAYTPAGTTAVTLATSADLVLRGGATVVNNGAPHHMHHRGHATHLALENPQHKHFPHPGGYDPKTGDHYGHPLGGAVSGGVLNIRSGEPQQITQAIMSRPFADNQTLTLTSVSFSYRYVVGYGGAGGGGKVGASLSLVSLDGDCVGSAMTPLYQSPRYRTPSYDKCHDCYSDPVPVHVDGLKLKGGTILGLRFDNGDHNLQILLPINLTLTWA